MHTRRRRVKGYIVLGISGLAFLVSSFPASASVEGRRNTARVLTGATIYYLAKGKTKEGVVSGAAAAYAWKRAIDSKKANDRKKEQLRQQACRKKYAKKYSKRSHRRYSRH